MNTVDSRAKRLPPFGREVRDMIFARRRPVLFGGAILVSLDWNLGACWSPRIVLPPDTEPTVFDLAYLRGCEILVILFWIHARSTSGILFLSCESSSERFPPLLATILTLSRLPSGSLLAFLSLSSQLLLDWR